MFCIDFSIILIWFCFVFFSTTQQIKDELCEVDAEMKALNLPEDCKDCKHSNKDKQMSIGRKKFNMDPKKGKKNMEEKQFVNSNSGIFFAIAMQTMSSRLSNELYII